MARPVLVVDDDPLVLEITATMLEELGCEVYRAASAAEALAELRKKPIAVLITDVNMPGATGYDLAAKAKDLCPDLQVLLLSGGESDGHGFPLIRKPFLGKDLRRAMEQTTGLC